MSIHRGGRGPGHLSRAPKAAASQVNPLDNFNLVLEDASGELLLESGDKLLLEDAA